MEGRGASSNSTDSGESLCAEIALPSWTGAVVSSRTRLAAASLTNATDAECNKQRSVRPVATTVCRSVQLSRAIAVSTSDFEAAELRERPGSTSRCSLQM